MGAEDTRASNQRDSMDMHVRYGNVSSFWFSVCLWYVQWRNPVSGSRLAL